MALWYVTNISMICVWDDKWPHSGNLSVYSNSLSVYSALVSKRVCWNAIWVYNLEYTLNLKCILTRSWTLKSLASWNPSWVYTQKFKCILKNLSVHSTMCVLEIHPWTTTCVCCWCRTILPLSQSRNILLLFPVPVLHVVCCSLW